MLTWIAESRALRIDTTAGGTQSLRPQSINFIQELKLPVRVVALYPKLKSDSHEQDYYQPVADLLNEYATKGKNITTEVLDPDTQKDEFNKLVTEVTNKYGGEVQGYKKILDQLPANNKAIDQFVTDEAAKFRVLPFDQIQDQELQQEISAAYLTLVLTHHQLADLKTAIDSDLNQQIPSYKDGVDETRTTYGNISQLMAAVLAGGNHVQEPSRLFQAEADQGLRRRRRGTLRRCEKDSRRRRGQHFPSRLAHRTRRIQAATQEQVDHHHG